MPPTYTPAVAEQVVIESRFQGPPDSANGGYACGTVARFIDAAAVEVTLRLPPPLERPLTIEREGETTRLAEADELIAEGLALAGLELELPDPVEPADAEAATRRSPLFHRHPFPGCFVCGPEREAGDGLRVIPGPVEGRELVAAPWRPDESLPRMNGAVATEVCWAALDCPSGNALMLLDDVGTAVLGRLAARFLEPVQVGARYVAAGWPLARDGRKYETGSALFGEGGRVVAYARARWIELRVDVVS
jgi:hypothetical protein